MPITAVTTDVDALTLTVVADFPVPVRRLWDAYLDPRQIEKFWGPPTYPAVFTRHDGAPGGESSYCMTGPEGDRSCGYWEWLRVDGPESRADGHASFEVRDGFAHEDGTKNTELPNMHMTFAFAPTALGSRLTISTHFTSLDELEQLTAMGMEEGMRAAMEQISAVVEDLAAFAATLPTQLQLLGETQARTSRVVRGTVEQVWHAHHDANTLRRWLLGPDGWDMPVCETASRPGERYRYEWAHAESGQRFGFVGEFISGQAPVRAVTSEAMTTPDDPDAANSPSTLNELTLTPVDGGTRITLLITYPDAATREAIISTGMVDGMETSYSRLDETVLAEA